METLTETTFTVKAENVAGIAYSYITVKPGRRVPVERGPEGPTAPRVTRPLREVTTEETTTEETRIVRIDVESHPPPKFTWYVDGVPVRPEERRPGTVRSTETTSELRIETTEITKETIITVRAENIAGVVESSLPLRPLPGQLAPWLRQEVREETEMERISRLQQQQRRGPEFAVPPRITRYLYDQTVEKEETIELVVEAEGQPPPRFTWFVNDLEIRPSATVQVLQPTPYRSILRLGRVTLPRAEYRVEVRNEVGRTTTKCVLTVRGT